MGQLILRRIATLLPTALVGSLLLFLLLQLIPGGVAAEIAGMDATAEAIERLERELGLDRPLAVQYLEWLRRIVLEGDFGLSLMDRRPIAVAIMERLPVTFELAGLALILSLIIGIPLGVLSATRHNTALDSTVTTFSGLGIAMPEFWLAMLAVNLFALHWALLPATGFVPLEYGLWEHIRSIILPVLTLSSSAAAAVVRFTRSGMIEALSSSYVRTAMSLGLSRRQVLFRFAMRNALIPVVTVVGILAGGLMGGAILVEQVFVIPGIGEMFVLAVQQKDYPTVQGVALVLIAIVITINLVVDIVCGLLDPRTR